MKICIPKFCIIFLSTLPALTLFFQLSAFGQTPAQPLSSSSTSTAGMPAQNHGSDLVTIQLPNNSVQEVISMYEALTGKRILRDANLGGPNLSILVPGTIPRKDAIALIESSLLLNGFSLVPLDDQTMKILGQGRSPLGESIPLYADPSLLPKTEELASYFMLLRYISPQDAIQVFNSYVTLRPQGSIVGVPNSNAIVITDTTTLIRRLIALQRFIDVPGARILTEFIPLLRADAEKVAEIVNKLLEEERSPEKATAANQLLGGQEGQQQPPVPGMPPDGTTPQMPIAGEGIKMLTTLIKVIPDPRTNRILVVAPESRMAYLQRLIRDLDAPVLLDQALERQLQFVSSTNILPVLQSILTDSADETSSGPRSGSRQNAGTGFPVIDSGLTGSSRRNDFLGSGSTSKPDKLSSPNQDTMPEAVSVGKGRIISDPSANKIIVLGPPELREKAARVIDLLDVRPKQVYLATIVGQLTLNNELEAGFDYLVRFKNFMPTSSGGSDLGVAGLLRNTGIVGRQGAIDILPSPMSLATNAAMPLLSGLTIYGTVAETVDIYAKFLQTVGDFQVLSRPVIYTANNKKAVISSGEQVPVPVSTLTTALNTNANNQTGTSLASNIQFKDVVLKLEVVPLINSENEVTLTIAQQNDNVVRYEQLSGNRVPTIGTQELTTTITVRNQNTVVLGGLIKEEESRNRSSIPLLGDIPGVGYLFSNTSKSKIRRELIILIQPFIIKDDRDLLAAAASLRTASKLNDQIAEMDNSLPVRRAEPVMPSPGQPLR
jgi:type II secretion system protein D